MVIWHHEKWMTTEWDGNFWHCKWWPSGSLGTTLFQKVGYELDLEIWRWHLWLNQVLGDNLGRSIREWIDGNSWLMKQTEFTVFKARLFWVEFATEYWIELGLATKCCSVKWLSRGASQPAISILRQFHWVHSFANSLFSNLLRLSCY